MSDETTLLREKLNKLIIEIERLDIKLDSPAYDMTLGEYEQEREKLLDGFIQAIAATLGSERGTCRIVKETKTIRSFIHGEVEVTDERCSECKGFMDVCCGVIRNYCPNCGRRVVE